MPSDDKRTPSGFKSSQDAAWEKAKRASPLPSTSASYPKTKPKQKKTAKDWQRVWNDATLSPVFDKTDVKSWQSPPLSPKSQGPVPVAETGGGKGMSEGDEEDPDYDAARPAVDYQGFWNEKLRDTAATMSNSRAQSQTPKSRESKHTEKSASTTTRRALKDKSGKLRNERIKDNNESPKQDDLSTHSGSDDDSQSLPCYAHAPGITRSRGVWEGRSIPFVGVPKAGAAKAQVQNITNEGADEEEVDSRRGGNEMFQRCVLISKEEATSVFRPGESWCVVKEEDADEEWEMLESANVEDDWDLVPEADRFVRRVDPERKGWNQRMREYFEGEKKTRKDL